jgi:hypothetical protein
MVKNDNDQGKSCSEFVMRSRSPMTYDQANNGHTRGSPPVGLLRIGDSRLNGHVQEEKEQNLEAKDE